MRTGLIVLLLILVGIVLFFIARELFIAWYGGMQLAFLLLTGEGGLWPDEDV